MDRRMFWLGLLVTAAGLLASGLAGCAPSVPGGRVTFANLAGIYFATRPDAKVEGALVEESETLLRQAVARLNETKDLDFVVITGDLFARPDALSLDRAKAILADLRVPYYVVLGDYDGPSPGEGPEWAATLSRSTLIWALQGHGFDGPEGYWSREVVPGLVLVGLDTASADRGGGPSPAGGLRPAGGHVDAGQLEWLDRTLSACRDKAVLVLAHHGLMAFHPLDEGSAWRDLLVDNAEEVRGVLARHPNVLVVLTGHHHFADGRASGPMVYLASPSVSVWPLAYHLIRLTTREAEAVWVPLVAKTTGDSTGRAEGDVARRAQERLLASPMYRGVFPPGEDGDTACVRLFGGKKMEVYPLPAIRP